MSDSSESRCAKLQLRMPAVRIQFVFLQQTAAGRRKIAEAEQEHGLDQVVQVCWRRRRKNLECHRRQLAIL